MSGELETAAAASLGGLKSGAGHDVPPPGEACRNCGATVTRRYCSACGQLASNFHRPVWTLIAETISDSLALDGRIARTLPALLFRPGHMTRAYLDGKRARYVPPFRLFLLCSLVFFTLFFFIADQQGWTQGMRIVRQGDDTILLQIGNSEVEDGTEILSDFRDENGRLDRDALLDAVTVSNEAGGTGTPEVDAPDTSGEIVLSEEDANARAIIDRAARLYENQELFFASVREMTPRVALILPLVFILILTLLYIWRRSIYVYDHMISALHVQSAIYLAISFAMVIAIWTNATPIFLILAVLPVYLLLHFRAAYGDGVIMAGLRTLVFLFVSLICVSLLIAGTLFLGAMSV